MNTMLANRIIFPFEPKSTIAAVLYICHKLQGTTDLHKLSKLLYFADQYHLSEYAQPITGDTYIAEKFGPVPIHTYHLLSHQLYPSLFKKQGYNITALKEPNMDELSEANLLVLDQIISQYGSMNFDKLTQASHGKAYYSVALKEEIPLQHIVAEIGVSDGMMALIADNAENSMFFAQ